ncbi:DUF3592 domain-containing protein [Corallococcus llansteffanensis]|uniref:DUF3592 domain-containing protein n=1 Tax=Corallococcus llansteffanensis TaxID=2316731 RepID=A0A3A8QJ56_9BACT|nr:DUF3592 domain-containing protein [Corallococcus llansteffanensis]RKH64912.1 DUF3592 domain-containing protein [Corallococcus llansteffanensis]
MALLAARLLGATFVLLGLTLLVMTWMTYRRDTRIVREGAHAQGTVLRKEFIAASDDSDYVLHYAFSLPDGTRLKQQHTVPPELWKRLRIGDSVQVLYGRDDPRRSYPEGHGVMTLGLALFFSVVLVLLGLIGLVALLGKVVPEGASGSLDAPSDGIA